MTYKQQAQNLVLNLNQCLNPSPYDIAWMARVQIENEPCWPDLLDWLLSHQYSDGSWGSEIVYYHDRIICTITAVSTLQQYAHTPEIKSAIKCAERYLWNHLHLLHRDPSDLVGFELLFPTLLLDAKESGLDVPNHTCGYGEIQAEKLRMLPPDLLYSPNVSIVHSLEFLGGGGNLRRLHKAINPLNGSLGNSPATTAYFVLLAQKNGFNADLTKMMAYLETAYQHGDHSLVVYPFQTFETTWVLNNLWFSGVPLTEFASALVFEKLSAEITPNGIGADASFGIPDGDSTAVGCKILENAGYAVDPMILAQFENKETQLFRTYAFERNPSISTNTHALETLLHMGSNYHNKQQVIDNIVLMLLDRRKYNIYWTDKWHISPYYATAHVLIALLASRKFVVDNCKPTVEWLLKTQYSDGSWGFFLQGTIEETAYVLTALLHYHQYRPIDVNILQRGAAYLAEAYENNPAYPPMWIEKCLFAPYDIIKSAILGALILYEDMFDKIR